MCSSSTRQSYVGGSPSYTRRPFRTICPKCREFRAFNCRRQFVFPFAFYAVHDVVEILLYNQRLRNNKKKSRRISYRFLSVYNETDAPVTCPLLTRTRQRSINAVDYALSNYLCNEGTDERVQSINGLLAVRADKTPSEY